ncbi:MAG: DUF3370 family protein [Candidatus Sericytochromatia bacterium]
MKRGPGQVLLAFLLAGCGPLLRQQPEVPAESFIEPVNMLPLPGQLDAEPLLHSNNPERIERPGVLLSTLPGAAGPFLNHALTGTFSVFLHHLARTPVFDGRRLWIGLLAHNHGPETLRIDLNQGNAFLTWPDAPFISLATQLPNDSGQVFAGPGDRVALATLRGESSLPVQNWELAPGSDTLLFQWLVPTNPLLFVQQDNALSALLRFHASAGIDLSLVALLQSDTPGASDWLAMLNTGQRAGPADGEATLYDPTKPPPAGPFRFSRVAGLTQGARWQGMLEIDLAQFNRQAYPVSGLYLKDLETHQNQSAQLLARIPGSAVESHGNYGVHYQLKLQLNNSSSHARNLSLALQQPLKVKDAKAEFRRKPSEQVRFRGSLKLTHGGQSRYYHLVLHEGEQAQPFASLSLPPQTSEQALLEWVYPPDATPPQLLTIATGPERPAEPSS